MPGRRKTSPPVEEVSETVQEIPPEDTSEQSVEVASDAPAEVVTHDEEDVQAALARDTQDGKGDEPVPESDFESYATEGVERTKSIQELAQEVLEGKHGRYGERHTRFEEMGFGASEVEIEVNRRRSTGAPYPYSPSLTELAVQVTRGEWGNEQEQRLRLEGAGYLHRYVMDEVNRLRGH